MLFDQVPEDWDENDIGILADAIEEWQASRNVEAPADERDVLVAVRESLIANGGRADAAVLAALEKLIADGFRKVEVTDVGPVTLDQVHESTTLGELLAEARRRGEWCCEVGCGSGACETCPCCAAGWCVSGRDGIPDDPDDRAAWLEVAREHNPVAAALGGGE